MQIAQVRRYAMALPEVTEQPHHQSGSFRVRGKIFVTMPPGDEYIHVFVTEEDRERSLALYPEFVEKLFWGGKVAGLRVRLAGADSKAVDQLISQAWTAKAPKTLRPAG
jgi:hypothetical protein